jgi:putative ABC transport system permease protein
VRAAARWISADIRARPGQALAAVAVVAGVVTALLLSATLLEGATNPWRGLFAQTRGAQIWLHLEPGTQVRPLARLNGVSNVAGPYRAAPATLVLGALKAPTELRAMGTTMPAVGRLLVHSGHWLSRSAPSGVVLEASFAQALHAGTGTQLVLEGLDGSSVRARVVGIADTSDQGFYPDQAPGLAWVQSGLLDQVEPVRHHTEEVAGLRLTEPQSAGFVVQEVVTSLGSARVISVSTWRTVQQSMARGDSLLGLLLALFGLVALGAAVLAIGNATGGWILVQWQDLAMLKTLGFTPRQVVSMLMAEHAALGLAGAAAGMAIARAVTDTLLQGLPAGMLAAVSPLPVSWSVGLAGGTELAVLLAAGLPGWRAARGWPVAAIRPAEPRGHLSGLARAALLSRLPPATVLGARAAFTRRLPALLTIGGLALPMMMITMGLGIWSTLSHVQRHPGDIGLAAGLTVSPGELTTARTRSILGADRQVTAIYRFAQVTALLPGETSTVTTLGAGSSGHPYPFNVAAGRLYNAPGEAVASQGLLDAAHLQVGDFIRMPVGGVPVIFHIVGRIIEPEYGGQVLAYGLDSLAQAGSVAPPVSYSLVLRPGLTPDAARANLLRISRGRLDVTEPVNPADQLGSVRVMLAGLLVVLALIGLTNLVTASAVGLRDHLQDVGVLRAIGLTPVQVMASLVTRTSVLALLAASCGASAGLALSSRLVSLGGQAYGIGAGLGSPPSLTAILTAIGVAVAAAAATAVIPARQAARLPVPAALKP